MRVHIWGGALAIAASAALFASAGHAGAAGANIRIDPASQSVAQGSTFNVRLVLSSSGLTSGIQATVVFDKSKVKIQSIAWGSAMANVTVRQPSDPSPLISAANSKGKLTPAIAAQLQLPDAFPTGDNEFLVITFKANGCGNAAFSLPVGGFDAQVVNGNGPGAPPYGDVVPVTTTGGSVNIDCGGAQPGASQSAGSQASASAATPDQSQAIAAAGTAGASGGPAGGDAAPGAHSAAPAGGVVGNPISGSGSGDLPLWLPIVFTIPAVAVIWLGLRKWRLATYT